MWNGDLPSFVLCVGTTSDIFVTDTKLPEMAMLKSKILTVKNLPPVEPDLMITLISSPMLILLS